MDHHSHTSRVGFTLVELLVVIGVIAVLITISVPAIGGAVIASRETVLISRLHGIGQANESYVGDHRFQLPQAGIPFKYEYSIFTGYLWRTYSSQCGFWTVALWPYFGAPNDPGMFSPWGPQRFASSTTQIASSIFQQNDAMFTQPRLWSPTDPIIDESQLIAPRASDVAYPSAKIAFFQDFPTHLFDPSLAMSYVGTQPAGSHFNTPILLADSSARLLPYQDLPPLVSNPWWEKTAAHIIPDSNGGLLRTLDGVDGRDF
ncbi:MAG: type II secretion system protein [Acidimicrobiia bacterium]